MALVLGTMYFGTRTDEAESFRLLDAFVGAGGRILDTANCYSFWESDSGSGGQSELVIGAWLKANPGIREQLSIATKVGVEPVDGRTEGLSAPVIRRSVELSLQRLGLDSIDLFWAHADDRETDLAETVTALGEVVAEGRADRIGLSNYATWRVEQARALAVAGGTAVPSALQLTTSYVSPRPWAAVPGKDHRFGFVTDETLDYLETHPGIDLWIYSPLVQGSYDRADRPFPEAYDHPGTDQRLAALRSIARERGRPASQIVLAWMLGRGWSPIAGVSSVGQLESALDAAAVELSPAEQSALDGPA